MAKAVLEEEDTLVEEEEEEEEEETDLRGTASPLEGACDRAIPRAALYSMVAGATAVGLDWMGKVVAMVAMPRVQRTRALALRLIWIPIPAATRLG